MWADWVGSKENGWCVGREVEVGDLDLNHPEIPTYSNFLDYLFHSIKWFYFALDSRSFYFDDLLPLLL